MKRTMTIGLLGAVLAVAVGFISTNAISATPFLMAGNEFSPNESAYMIGHVEYTVRGADGQVKQYAQGDNLIVERGKDCAAQMIFDNSSSTACTITSGTTGFNFIAIGNATGAVSGDELQLDTGATVGEIDRTSGTVTIDITGADTIATITTTTPFAFTSISSTTVQQSGLFDNASPASGNMFAMRDALAIPVTSADTLAVTWKITLQ
ncbi:MAG: hypothetical protein ACT4NJ_07765 [Nitrosopumilaceae archaeon]